ncbi:hypothetical protein L7F22_014098, partial [Adiantum nelumboides]|nr:hypothetical protein [Adiantum nelumboides]
TQQQAPAGTSAPPQPQQIESTAAAPQPAQPVRQDCCGLWVAVHAGAVQRETASTASSGSTALGSYEESIDPL